MKLKLFLFALITFHSPVFLIAAVSSATEQELNNIVSDYVDALNHSNKDGQRNHLCEKDLPQFDQTSSLYFLYPVFLFFTGTFTASPVQNLTPKGSSIDADVSLTSSRLPWNSTGKVTFVQENEQWKACDLRHK